MVVLAGSRCGEFAALLTCKTSQPLVGFACARVARCGPTSKVDHNRKASHNLNRLLDEPGGPIQIIGQLLDRRFTFELNQS